MGAVFVMVVEGIGAAMREWRRDGVRAVVRREEKARRALKGEDTGVVVRLGVLLLVYMFLIFLLAVVF